MIYVRAKLQITVNSSQICYWGRYLNWQSSLLNILKKCMLWGIGKLYLLLCPLFRMMLVTWLIIEISYVNLWLRHSPEITITGQTQLLLHIIALKRTQLGKEFCDHSNIQSRIANHFLKNLVLLITCFKSKQAGRKRVK